MPLLHRRSCPRSDFRRLACRSTCAASRLRGFYLRQVAFLRSGYSPRPKPLPSSNFTLLQVLALSTPASALAVAVRSLCYAFDESRTFPSFDFHVPLQLRGTGSLSSPGQDKESVLVLYPGSSRSSCDDRAWGRSCSRRTFRCCDQHAESRAPPSFDGSTCSVAMLVVSRPRASFDAGLLMPRFVSQCLFASFRMLEDLRVHPLCTLRCSENRSTTVHHPQGMATPSL